MRYLESKFSVSIIGLLKYWLRLTSIHFPPPTVFFSMKEIEIKITKLSLFHLRVPNDYFLRSKPRTGKRIQSQKIWHWKATRSGGEVAIILGEKGNFFSLPQKDTKSTLLHPTPTKDWLVGGVYLALESLILSLKGKGMS